MELNLKGKIVIVTGAAKGIGKIIAQNFAKEGAKLSLWDIDYEELLKVKETIANTYNETPLALKCDVSAEDEVGLAVKKTIDNFGTIDVLIANAGILNPSKILETTAEKWDQVFDVNTKGPFLCAKAVAPYMKEKILVELFLHLHLQPLYHQLDRQHMLHLNQQLFH